MKDVTKAIKYLLKPSGVFIFEVHYIGSLIDEVQYDMIYHEHIYYYSHLLCRSLSEFELEIFDVKEIKIHGGSMRYYVRNFGELKDNKISSNLINLQKSEYKKGYDKKSIINYAKK